MKNLDLTKQTVGSLSRLIKRKEISPVELTKATLERIEKLDGTLKAFVTVMKSQALQAAKDSERAIMAGKYLGPYHGIPVAVKDLYYTKGVRTTASSKVLADFIPDYDATVVTRLKTAGAVIIGKTNTHEFAYGYTTLPTRNPWDTQRIPGGSSGGSGAAVAASMCIAATGTDTGGSIRVPSSMNGIVGIKPTFGRVSKHGVIVLSWSLDNAGPMTKSMEDAAMMMNIVAGYDPKDASSVDIPVPDYTKALKGGIKGVRLGIPKEYFLDPLDAEVSAAFKKAVEVLKGMGATVEEISLPYAPLAGLAALYILISEASSYHEQWFKTKANLYTPEVNGYIKFGNLIPAPHYIKAQRLRKLICNDFDLAFKKVDALITPTLPMTAPKVGEAMVDLGTAKVALNDACGRNMYPLSMAGLPALSLPCGFSQNGLPIGLQVIGRPFDESEIIKIANNYEKSTDWHLRRPPV
jgi:aspartyl-tRNA(Asn)/glutamyl-tRNA(Gln) amidotransferase subunit A